MANDRLRDALLRHGLTPAAAAEHLGVDPKTAERWITQDRVPYPRHRHALAALVRESEAYLWPDALSPERAMQVGQSEVVDVYPARSAVPAALWRRLIDQAEGQIGILVYAGLFLPEQQPRLVPTLKSKAQGGTQMRILLGRPASAAVAQRGVDESIGEAMASKIFNVMAFYSGLRRVDGVEIRFHDTTLYNSIYWFDDEMLVNTHVYGVPAAHAPAMHLRRLSGGDLFQTYAASFEQVFASADATWPEEDGKLAAWPASSTTTTRTRRSPTRSSPR